jgi:imidazolonepropionase-like amidohydrolase
MAYERCHWPAAFDAFTAAADGGAPEAARMALAMARHGRLLYGQVFVVSAVRRSAWERLGRLAARSGANAHPAQGSTQ